MEAAPADGSTNSKVIVQFTDPGGLFNDVAPLLQNRLPLGNLHWKSPTRPLRSIEELDVSLDREQPPSHDGPTSTRRHQIPGLAQTPFVKVLLVRCDDKDKYKESVRKEVKEWVKSLGFSTSGKATTKGQERHDAYEYIILHVVLPGTTAAAQPRSSKHISVEMADSTDSVNSKSKWTGKSTSTILDKLRADFSSSSKVPFERVAQIRLTDPAKPSSALSPLDIEAQWLDLIEKLKTAILQSFDARVAQYEEDIREREQQRSLPGWNFCTFFILKEGLARGFENVGLLEDALQIYEELDAGLDAVIQDQAKEDYSDAANALLPYANDLKDTIRTVLEGKDNDEPIVSPELPLGLQAWTNAESKRFPWRLERRNYQQMILTNQVSALDFRVYIFIRQMQIMLRRASMSAHPPQSKSSNRQSGIRWDANVLSEICERSIKFMNLAARNLRQDLFAAWGGREGLPEEELRMQQLAIGNIVASWKWSSLLQTLSECQIIASLSSLSARRHGENESAELFSPTDIASSHAHSHSTSTISSSSVGAGVNGTDTSNVNDVLANLRIVKGSKTGLTFWAAELFTMLRTIFQQLCHQRSWLPHPLKVSDGNANSEADPSVGWTGVLAPSLRALLQSKESAVGAYRLLTVCACQCYTSAGKSRASRQLLFDLAKLEAHNDDSEAAGSWLDAIPGFLTAPPGTSTERSMLGLHADCLRKAGRREELISSLFLDIQSTAVPGEPHPSVQQLWAEMVEVSEKTGLVELPLDALFAIAEINNHISHDDSQDQYLTTITLRALVPIKSMDNAVVRLECQSRGQYLPASLNLECKVTEPIEDSRICLQLSSNVQTEGWYGGSSLIISSGNLRLKHDFLRHQAAEADDRLINPVPVVVPSIYIYPRAGSPSLSASHAPIVDLSQKRSISIRVRWPSNDVSEAQLRLKPATAGARLNVQSAQLTGGKQFEIQQVDDYHVFAFESIEARGESVFEIPYSHDDKGATSMSIRAEMQYESSAGRYEYYDTLSCTTSLPIGANVQDAFQRDASFSRFTFAPSRLVPLQVLKCELEGSAECDVLAPRPWHEPVNAFPKQPVSWVVQTKPRSTNLQALDKKEKLVLSVEYKCIDEAILNTILSTFHHEATSSDITDRSQRSVEHATRAFLTHLRKRVQSLWSEQDIELAALTGEIQMWSYEEMNWEPLLLIFEKHSREHLRRWLRDWHERPTRGPLKIDYDTAPTRTLRLLVDTPRVDVVVTTQIEFRGENGHCVVGRPLLARMRAEVDVRVDTDVEVTVEVTGQNDSWLAGGQRKATFGSSQKVFEGTIVLIAQRTGNLLLPGVEVRCRNTRDRGESVAFEVDDLSSAMQVQARNDVRTTTIGLGGEEAAEGHWLIDSSGHD